LWAALSLSTDKERQMRIALLSAAILLMVGCSSTTSSPSPAPQTPVAVELADFKITPSTLNVSAGNVTFQVTSQGPTLHNFTIRDAAGESVANSVDLHAGDSDEVTANLAAGEYVIFCSFAGHESLGMHSALTVTSP
jgi:uncharacterized cupredoxin-like copper-binding protein